MKINQFILFYLFDIYFYFIIEDLSYIKKPWIYFFKFAKFTKNILTWISAIIGFPLFYFILEYKKNKEFFTKVMNELL